MTSNSPRAMRASAAILIAALVVTFLPLPGSRSARVASCTVAVARTEPRRPRIARSGGYYAGLIEGSSDTGRDELTLSLLGKATEWKSFHQLDATRYLRGDILQFELKPNVHETMFGRAFTTNDQGLRDRSYAAVTKPEGTFRIALLGSSMDMGWGVGTDETYENRLEDWLNAHAAKRGLSRRFEVINFAMAAYSPIHRLETFRRKARDYQPDLVLYSATMLDSRLLEIHVRNLIVEGIDPQYPFLREAIAAMDIAPVRREGLDKDVLHRKGAAAPESDLRRHPR